MLGARASFASVSSNPAEDSGSLFQDFPQFFFTRDIDSVCEKEVEILRLERRLAIYLCKLACCTLVLWTVCFGCVLWAHSHRSTRSTAAQHTCYSIQHTAHIHRPQAEVVVSIDMAAIEVQRWISRRTTWWFSLRGSLPKNPVARSLSENQHALPA